MKRILHNGYVPTFRMNLWRMALPLSTYCDIKTEHRLLDDWWLINNKKRNDFPIRIESTYNKSQTELHNRNDCVVLNGWNSAADAMNNCILLFVAFLATRTLRENILLRIIIHHSSLISLLPAIHSSPFRPFSFRLASFGIVQRKTLT